MSGYVEGEKVVVLYTGGNERVTREPVVKVGRSLVHVEDRHGNVRTFRKDTGVINSAYPHFRIFTEEVWERRQRRANLFAQIGKHGVTFRNREQHNDETLVAILAALDAEARPQ